ncbi:MAG: site-specific integrase [Candidatus Marinimicrobia bacterium]|jgi:integrase|nr:site-specific integrase [Candidatus Neomarinimicrobiota bacterium]MBT4360687.1 site-specific integrase [Candidatus Neomarinimicrobiota bacterium]MBT4716066.1 site-specific integrase [Candidatus Neomarinimicrobiota bacterium]MBT4946072.1 site-specific integrase [Candidatus Neomarinimicrobiota bacterium]MBT5269518.1 site-specific integrase [Candidatus Neomarinimicrobiota bacterium]
MATIKEITLASGGSSWKVTWGIGGGRKKSHHFRDEKLARRFAKEQEVKSERVRHGLEVALEPNLPITVMVAEYLKRMTKHKDSETIRRESSIYKALIVFLGDVRIRSINKIQLSNYLEYRQKECGIRQATAATEYRTLRAFLNTLISYNYLKSNPILAVKPPRTPEKEIIILTDSEVKGFLNKIDSPNYKDLFQMYLHTGARRGELLPQRPLTWDNVDFRRREITLIGKKRIPRIVPLDNIAFEIVRRRKFLEKHEYPFKFDYHFLYKKYLRYLKAAKVEATGLHSLRRTYGSRLVESGVDIVDVSKMMGHRDIRITMKHYIHISSKKLHEAAKKLNDVWT